VAFTCRPFTVHFCELRLKKLLHTQTEGIFKRRFGIISIEVMKSLKDFESGTSK